LLTESFRVQAPKKLARLVDSPPDHPAWETPSVEG
jgi:hypothetical protein